MRGTVVKNGFPAGHPARTVRRAALGRAFLALSLSLALPGPQRARCADDSAALNESPAAQLLRKELYADAARLLEFEVKEGNDSDNALRFLMLGESYYMLEMYDQARPWFQKAFQNLPQGANRIIAQYRLASVAYRLADPADALKRTDEFIRAYPNDRRGGNLLILRMKLLASRGRGAERELEAVRAQIAAGGARYDGATHVAADKILTDFHFAAGNEEKAVNGYLGIVNNFRKAQAESERSKRPVPPDLQDAYDYAAMQLGSISVKAQREGEAIKWLESIRFNTELVQVSRLMLAQIAYRDRDYRRAERYLLDDALVEKVESDDLRSDMYLVLGFCAKKSSQPSLDQVFDYFGRVKKGTKGYAQAQMGMADTALKWRQPMTAAQHFENACISSKYEAEALYNLGKIYIEAADAGKDEGGKKDLLSKAADRFNSLVVKYAATQFAKDANNLIAELIAKGYEVRRTVSDEEILRQWETVVTNAPGTAEAARTLLNIARIHQKAVLNEKTRQFIKAPDYAACAHACNRLLSEKAFAAAAIPLDQWTGMRCEALYLRGLSAVSSLGRPPPVEGTVQPVYVKDAELGKALADLSEALRIVDKRDLELVRNLEIARLEGLFKSDNEDDRRLAEKGFGELLDKYGREPRLQRLATDLARWRMEQGDYVAAADLYKGVADRAGDELSRADLVDVFFMAGKLYSRAAQDAGSDRRAKAFGIMVHPRGVIRLDGIIESHKPFQNVARIEGADGEITAEEAIRKLSQSAGIPFVWGRSAGAQLRNRRLKMSRTVGTVQELLREILDLKTMDIAFDIGMTGAAPTLKTEFDDSASPDELERNRTIEIFVRGDWAGRYDRLSRPYGVWRGLHPGACMMYSVVRRVEEVTGTSVVWADGVNSEDVLAVEYASPRGINPTNTVSVADVLTSVLDQQGMAFRIVPRNVAGELYEKAKDCFNEVRKIAPKSDQGEESLFVLALNYYRQEDYGRMKIVLQEYLKVFDGPGYPHYHQACFWVGWVVEKDRRFREAAKHYQRAAEEYLTVCRADTNAAAMSKEALSAALSYDTRFSLDEAVSGTITNMSFADEFLHFVRLNSSVDVRLDPSAEGITAPVDIGSFRDARVYDLFWDVITGFGLTFRAGNVDKASAEKAYYRMAVCLKEEGMNEQALAACQTLLSRYPATGRRKDASKLRLDIHKALKNYAAVLEDLEIQRAQASEPSDVFQADYARAWVLMDLCRHAEAEELFRKSLSSAVDREQRLAVRDGYARALMLGGKPAEALTQFEALVKEETSELRLFVGELLVWKLRRELGRESGDELPAAASAMMRRYESLDEQGRANLDRSEMTKVTWTYYVTGLYDLMRKDVDRALAKFDAASGSPDDWMAADAILQAARIHLAAGRLDGARESLEFLLFSTKAPDAESQALRLLAVAYERMGDTRRAAERLDALVRRYPNSAAGMELLRERAEKAGAGTGAGDSAANGAGGAETK